MKSFKNYFMYAILFGLLIVGCSGESIAPGGGADFGALSDVFDLQWLPTESFGDEAGTVPIQDGKPVRLIKDGIGNLDIPYTGADVPSVRYTTPPVFKKGRNGEQDYIFFPNAKGQTFGDDLEPLDSNGNKIVQPWTVYAVVRRLQAINNEAYWARGFGFRNRNNDHYELKVFNSGDEFAKDAGIMEANKISIVKVEYNGSKSKLWINNVPYAGGASIDVGTHYLQLLGYSTVSHVAHHDMFGFWMKFGILTKEEDDFAYSTLAKIFDPGKFPPYAIPDNLDIVWNNNDKSWTIDYDYVSPDPSTPEANTKYQWYVWQSGETLEDVYPLSGPKAQNKTLFRSDFPDDLMEPYPSGAQIYCGVTVEGNWRELHSPYEKDNIK